MNCVFYKVKSSSCVHKSECLALIHAAVRNRIRKESIKLSLGKETKQKEAALSLSVASNGKYRFKDCVVLRPRNKQKKGIVH